MNNVIAQVNTLCTDLSEEEQEQFATLLVQFPGKSDEDIIALSQAWKHGKTCAQIKGATDLLAHTEALLDQLHQRVTEMQEAAYTLGEYSQEAVSIALDGVLDVISEKSTETKTGTDILEDESAEGRWRRLALQFDNHRLQALGHIRAMLQDPAKHAPVAAEFLRLPPLDGQVVLAQRIAALLVPAASTPDNTDTPVRACNMCERILDNPQDAKSLDCGGDCLQCMADAGDPEAVAALAGTQ